MSTRKREVVATIAEELLSAEIREVGGANRGEFVTWFQREIGGAAQEPWCMAAVQKIRGMAERILAAAGLPEPSAAARSELCMDVWDSLPADRRFTLPARGLVAVWQKRSTRSGHTGVCLKDLGGGRFESAEGNTGPGPGVEREGDGYYRKTRTLEGWGDMEFLGFGEL